MGPFIEGYGAWLAGRGYAPGTIVGMLAMAGSLGRWMDARLPILSTYLGHRDPRSTYWYLSAAPELLALAAGQLERSQRAACR